MAELDDNKVLANIKKDLDIADKLQDDVINELIRKVLAHFVYEYDNEPLAHHSFIIEDCVIKRFNRRGAEGAKSERVEGHSVTYEDEQYEFELYDARLRDEFKLRSPRTGGLKFI